MKMAKEKNKEKTTRKKKKKKNRKKEGREAIGKKITTTI
jgi:hypothetical protein